MFARRQKKSAKSGQAAAAALLIKETLLGGQTKILVSIKGIVSRDFELLGNSASAAKQLLLAITLARENCVGGQ